MDKILFVGVYFGLAAIIWLLARRTDEKGER